MMVGTIYEYLVKYNKQNDRALLEVGKTHKNTPIAHPHIWAIGRFVSTLDKIILDIYTGLLVYDSFTIFIIIVWKNIKTKTKQMIGRLKPSVIKLANVNEN